MIQLAITIGDIIMPKSDTDRQLRVGIFQRLSEHPGASDFLVGMKFKPRPRYSKGAFVGLARPNVPASLVGCMIPQPRIRIGGTSVPLDDLLGTTFAIITQCPELERFARLHSDQLWPELTPTIISLSEDSVAEDGDVAFSLRAHRDQLLLVRPDRYIAIAFWPHELERVVAEFRSTIRATHS
jgi:3-(3-hydroxy-phenyl)propionate hydroxylase